MEKKYEEIDTLINCDLSKFRIDLPYVAIRNYIRTENIFDIFPTS